MFNNPASKTNISVKPGTAGVFNQFITPSSPDEEIEGPQKDIIKKFLIMLLALTVVIAVGSFLFTNLLDKQVESKKQQLVFYDSTPDLSILETNLTEMDNLSQRLKLVNSIYDNKVYLPSMLFPIIESLTESNYDSYVYFNGFSLKKQQDKKLTSITLKGVAIDYPTLYRQITNFKNNKYVQNFKMGSMSQNSDGFILFDVSFESALSLGDFIKFMNESFTDYVVESSAKSGPLFKIETEPVSTASSTDNTLGENKETASSTPEGGTHLNSSSTSTSRLKNSNILLAVNLKNK